MKISFSSMQNPEFVHEQFQYHDHQMHSIPTHSNETAFLYIIFARMPKLMLFFPFPVAHRITNEAIDFDRWILRLKFNRQKKKHHFKNHWNINDVLFNHCLLVAIISSCEINSSSLLGRYFSILYENDSINFISFILNNFNSSPW